MQLKFESVVIIVIVITILLIIIRYSYRLTCDDPTFTIQGLVAAPSI